MEKKNDKKLNWKKAATIGGVVSPWYGGRCC